MTEPPAADPLDSDMYEYEDNAPSYATPEEVASAEWTSSPGARARILGAQATSDQRVVHVVMQLEVAGNDDTETVICVQARNGRWWSSGSFGGS